MSSVSALELIQQMENLGKQRAKNSTAIVEAGGNADDYLVDNGFSIHDPWLSSCGRFEIDPYITHGQKFIEWLMKPFSYDYDETTQSLKRKIIQIKRVIE